MWKRDTWGTEDFLELRQYLHSLRDEKYKVFHSKLIPGLDKNTLIGVRLPLLRKIGKEIAKGNALPFLAGCYHDFYEEVMLHGIVIGSLKCDFQIVLKEIENFVPYIDNWAVCDSFVSGLSIVKKNKEDYYSFIDEYLHKKETYALRFAVISLMDYYTESQYITEVLQAYGKISHDDYYVKMAVAWGISVAYIKEKDKTLAFLNQNHLDDFTYNKALQKIVESNRVPKEEKIEIRKMKRK